MLKNLEMLLHPAELTHASDKFDFTTKEFGADKEIRSKELRRWRGGGQSARSSLNVIGSEFILGNNYVEFLKRE